ncbi:MAG: type II toxin-antitoxin system VapC family toxin [Planctomycetota bacterium]
MKATILDAFALLAYVRGEPAADGVSALLAAASDSRTPLLMTVVNLGEVYYTVRRRHGASVQDEVERRVRQLPIRIVDADEPMAKVAARFKATRPMSYADCFAAALAKQRKGRVVTGDPEFRAVEDEIEILWLPGA